MTISEWSVVIQGVMIIALVAVTIWYAYMAQKMAKTMSLQHEFDLMPLLVVERDVKRFFDEKNDKKLQLQFLLRNVGKVPVKYVVHLLELNKKSINHPRSHVILVPGQNGTIFSNEYIDNSGIRDHGDNLKGKIKMEYWTEGKPKDKYIFKRNFTLVQNFNTFVYDEEIKKVS